MNKHQLAHMLLEWFSKTKGLARLRKQIEDAVLERKESMTVGFVRAVYKTDGDYPRIEVEIIPDKDKAGEERWLAEYRKRKGRAKDVERKD